MQNDKVFLVLLVIAIVVALGFVLWGFGVFSPTAQVPTYQPTQLPHISGTAPGGTSTTGPATGNQLSDITLKTGNVSVTLKNPATVTTAKYLGAGQYNVTDLNQAMTADYNVVFNAKNGTFAIALLNEPIAKSRTEAAQYMMGTFGLTQKQLCQLPIFVGVPHSVNQFYAGKNLGFGFCAGAIPLQ